MSVDYIYTRSAQRLSTPNDVTILASAPEVTDNGYVIGNESYFPNPSGYLRYAGITMTGSSNRLTLGGNPYVTYNIRYTGKEMHREVAAANFTGNGTIVFSAQSAPLFYALALRRVNLRTSPWQHCAAWRQASRRDSRRQCRAATCSPRGSPASSGTPQRQARWS